MMQKKHNESEKGSHHNMSSELDGSMSKIKKRRRHSKNGKDENGLLTEESFLDFSCSDIPEEEQNNHYVYEHIKMPTSPD